MRQKLQRIFGEEYAEYVEVLAMGRERIIEATPNGHQQKKERIEKLMDAEVLSLLREGKKKEALDLVEDFLQQHHQCHKPKINKK